MNLYFEDVISNFVLPGMVGGFIIFFSVFILTLAISLAINLLKNQEVFNMVPMVETSAIVTALQGVASNAQSVINDVAPIGIGILGIFLVWRLGIRMFKSLAGK